MKNGKIYTQCYENGQFCNETAECSSAERGSRDNVLSKRETDHAASKRRRTSLSAAAKTGRIGDVYRTEKTYLQELWYSLSLTCRRPGSLSGIPLKCLSAESIPGEKESIGTIGTERRGFRKMEKIDYKDPFSLNRMPQKG
jgi:hypothetical protein